MGGALGRAFTLVFNPDSEILQIAATSLALALTSTIIAALLGTGLALILRLQRLPGRRVVLLVINSLVAVPTVVIGLTVYALLSRSGPLGSLGLIYTRPAIVIGQTALALPILASLIYRALRGMDRRLEETLATLRISRPRRLLLALDESREAIIVAIGTGFGRVIGEIGVSMMLGGNIRFRTRTITTAIALETGKGELEQALAHGIVLLAIALAINALLLLGTRDADR